MKRAFIFGIAMLAGCSAGAPEGGGTVAAPSAPAAGVTATHGSVVSYFEGSVDPARGTFTLTYKAAPGTLSPEQAFPPSGSGPVIPEGTDVTMHTVPGTVHYNSNQCATNALCGDVQAINHLGVTGTFFAYVDHISATGVTGGPWGYTNVAANSTSAAVTWNFDDPLATPFSFSGHVEGAFASCKVIHQGLPGFASGLYQITPGGTFTHAYCDMSFDDGLGGGAGGWTLIEETDSNTPPSSLSPGIPTLSAVGYMPTSTMEALAAASSQIYILGQDGVWVSSRPNLAPIMHLRAGAVVDQIADAGGSNEVSLWTGTGADSRMNFGPCDTVGESYPSIYHACDNGTDGFHLVTTSSTWHWQTPNIAFHVFVR